MSESQEQKVYRLLPIEETLGLADLNPDFRIAPENVGQRIVVPVKKADRYTPNHQWATNREGPTRLCDLYEGRLGNIIVSVPANLKIVQVRPDLDFYRADSELFRDNYRRDAGDVVPEEDAVIQNGILEKVRGIVLMNQQVLRIRSAMMDATRRETKTEHFLIDHPYRKHHIEDGGLIVFRDLADEDQMIGVIARDTRQHRTIDEVLNIRDPKKLGKATEGDVRREWKKQMQTEWQAFERHGLKSFQFRLFPEGIPLEAPKRE